MSNPPSIEEDLLTEIEIQDYNHNHQEYYDYYSTPSNFSVNFTVNHIDRLILTSNQDDNVNNKTTTTSSNDDIIILTKNNPPRAINQSTTLRLEPNNGYTWSNLDFCLQFCLHLDPHVRQLVLHKLETYVTLNPTPASLVVSINRVEVHETTLYNDSSEDNDDDTAALKRTRVDDVAFGDGGCSICLVNWSEERNVSSWVACMPVQPCVSPSLYSYLVQAFSFLPGLPVRSGSACGF